MEYSGRIEGTAARRPAEKTQEQSESAMGPEWRRKHHAKTGLRRSLTLRSRGCIARVVTIVTAAVLLIACGEQERPQETSPPKVAVTTVVRKTVPIYDEFVAQVDARETVEIRARVQAFLEAQHFTEGSVVDKGQLLFTLDKREYETKLQQAEAELDIALARLGRAKTDERRLKPLAARKAVPQQDYDDAAANLQSAQANVSAARAEVAAALLDLSYTSIHSPITGLIGKRLVAPGNLVGKGEPTLLDTVSSIDPIHVNATISEAEYLRFFAQRSTQGEDGSPMELILADGSVFPHKGRRIIVDRSVDPKTGTLSFVAEFPNPDRLLRPGQFARVRGIVKVVRDALVIPKLAVQETQGVQSVLVVDGEDVATLRTIQPGETVGDLLIVRKGLKAGERVIVDGTQKVQPESRVNPIPATSAPSASPPVPAGAQENNRRTGD